MKILSHSIHIAGKTGTRKIQSKHRMRLRQFFPRKNLINFGVNGPQFYADPNVIDEPKLSNNDVPQLGA